MAGRGVAVQAGVVVAIVLGVGAPVSAQSLGGPGAISISAGTATAGTITTSGTLANTGTVTLTSTGTIGIPGGRIGVPTPPPAPCCLAAVGAPAVGVPAVAPQLSVVATVPTPGSSFNPALGTAPAGITVRQGGLVGLVGSASARSGVITATVDKVRIGGTEALTVDLAGDGLLNLQVARPVLDAHGRALSPDSRTVALSASAARDVVSGVTNAQGVSAAKSVAREGGVIVFGAPPAR